MSQSVFIFEEKFDIPDLLPLNLSNFTIYDRIYVDICNICT